MIFMKIVIDGFGGDNAAPIEAAGLALLALNTSKRKPGMKARVT